MTSTYAEPQEPRDRTRSGEAKRRTLERKSQRLSKYAGAL